jgi:hypothetical protein
MEFSSPSPVARALAKAREVESAIREASRQFEIAKDYADLGAADELAAKASALAAELHQVVALFRGMVKSELAVRRPPTLW